MLTIDGFAIDISKIIEGVLIAALGGIVGFAIGKVRDIKRKKKKREAQRKKLVEPILAQLNNVVNLKNIEHRKSIAKEIARKCVGYHAKSCNVDEDAQEFIRCLANDLYNGHCPRALCRPDALAEGHL